MSALEIGMYVLLGVFCLAITVFVVNCMVFVWRYQKKRVPFYTEGQSSVQNASDWVWIGKATLERNSINTGCSQTLMPEADFNGNRNANAPGATSTLHPRSGSTSARSSGVSGSGGTGSNRNSYVSTYKGSECSIRITSNPHPEANPSTSKAGADGGASTPATAPAPPATPKATERLQRSPLNDDDIPPIDGVEDMTDDGEDQTEEPLVPPPVPPHAPKPPQLPADGANPPSGECFDWDYEQMGMTYDQLMDYFDNLKESTA